jgi:AcrR family transcriptional regulator
MTATLSPRERLLSTATRLFYGEGIHTVPVDRLVTEAGVTRATFYRHFPAKEDLVAAYLEAMDQRIRSGIEAVTQGKPAEDALQAVLGFFGEQTCGNGFRGCAFINAAAEYSNPADPVRMAVAAHRAWFRETVGHYVSQLDLPDPEYVVATLVLLRDGAMQAGELDDPSAVRATLHRAVRNVLTDVRNIGHVPDKDS